MSADAPMLVVGGGIGGLIAAIDLAATGTPVRLFERAATVGGKLRTQTVDGHAIDAGPTVFTLADVFEASLARAGTSLWDELQLQPAEVLARHFWPDGSRLDLFADHTRSVAAVREFAGHAAGDQLIAFLGAAERAARVLDTPFMRRRAPSMAGLMLGQPPRAWLDLARVNPFASLWNAVGRHFDDPRLQQLFARYATYTGSDPFRATASLILIAHVEQAGVWQIEGGMIQLARTLAHVATRLGVDIQTGQHVTALDVRDGRAHGLWLADERYIAGRAIVFNGDARALAEGHLGEAARSAVPRRVIDDPALSGVTWALYADTRAAPLSHHNVFFCDDYRREFRDIFGDRRLPEAPTVYICAQDRAPVESPVVHGRERLLCLVNAPPGSPDIAKQDEAIRCLGERIKPGLATQGLSLDLDSAEVVSTGPGDFAAAFPGSRGALYGQAAHGWRAPFQRPTARSRIAGLYLAGGSCHPGAGLPMAALSGQHAAAAVLKDHP